MVITTDSLRTLIREELADLVEIRHDLHAHPELGYQESRTSGVVRDQLLNAGVEIKTGLARGTGVLGHLRGPGDDAIGLRADMDALPIQEVTDVEYRSQHDGVMHACGHDGHTTILIGAARVLARIANTDGLRRPVTFVFQPAEEGGAGAREMVNDGCLSGDVLGPPIVEIFGLHGWPRMPLGSVGSRSGPMLAAADSFDITITGVGSHAAWPQVGKDPIVAGAAVVTALQTISSRNVRPLDPVVVSVTQFHSGTTYNIIPGQAELTGTVRTLSPEVQDQAEKRLSEIATAIAGAHGCTADVRYSREYPPTVNDAGAVETFRTVAREAFGPAHVLEIDDPVMGGEDFAFYAQKIPACFFVLGLIPDGARDVPDLHQPMFNFNDDAMAHGIEMFCRLALR
jgi:amidohydrolase